MSTKSEFIYVTYIRTTPAKLWQALIDPEFTRQYFFGSWHDCEWKQGAPWKLVQPDGSVPDSGEVLEIEPERRLILKWRNEKMPEAHAEGYSRMTYEIEQDDDSVKLTVTHSIDVPDSKLIKAVSRGWPMILSNLKSLLETGHSLDGASPCSRE